MTVAEKTIQGAAAFPEVVTLEHDRFLQFWESDATRPQIDGASPEGIARLRHLADGYLPTCLLHPFRSADEVKQEQFERVRYLVEFAYHEVPIYAEKYKAAGFRPSQLRSWEDFERLPVITKDELIAAAPDRCLSRRWAHESLYSTRTFGSSGKTLLLKVNQDAILVDTLQGVRQFWLQSGLKYHRDQLAAMIYTVPWWFEAIGNDFHTAFISGLITPERVSNILDKLRPHVISCYPTNLKALLPFLNTFDRSNLHLAVVHSESSSASERRRWSAELGVPVLDEYSSEESTRIALELPCGHYHVCEDSVCLEVLDPETHQPCPDGSAGLAVVTNLLNEAMPIIRYVQGDYVTRPQEPGKCVFGWSQLASVDGRVNDSFINLWGQEVPAGTILDVTYRWMFDAGVHIKEFELVQKAPDAVQATLLLDGHAPGVRERSSLVHLEELLQVCLGHPVRVEAEMASRFPKRKGKRRPIRREFAPSR